MTVDVHVAIISTKRERYVPAMEAWCAGLDPTWYVGPAEGGEYRWCGAERVVEVPGGLCAARNAAMDAAGGRPCLQLSDDLKRLGWANGTKRADVVALGLADALGRMLDALGPAQLAGVAPTDNPFYSKARVHPAGFVLGDMHLTAGGCPLRFDEGLALKEDYDYTLQHLATYGQVARLDQLLASFEHRTNRGGAVAVRTPELEQECIARLMARWPEHLRPNPRRPNEILLRWSPR